MVLIGVAVLIYAIKENGISYVAAVIGLYTVFVVAAVVFSKISYALMIRVWIMTGFKKATTTKIADIITVAIFVLAFLLVRMIYKRLSKYKIVKKQKIEDLETDKDDYKQLYEEYLARVVDAECRAECAESDAEFYKNEYEELRENMTKLGYLRRK